MLRLPPFKYLAPRTLTEAVEMLAENYPHAMLVAGGTDVYPGMKRRIFEPKTLIDLRHLKELKTFNANAVIENRKSKMD
jgi:4-hydroxybenzoyl-CoA reductase subunit beta